MGRNLFLTAMAASLLLASCNPMGGNGVMLPPPQYDHPFTGRKIIEHVPYFQIDGLCRRSYTSCNDISVKGSRIEAFSFCFIDGSHKKACHYVYPLVTDVSKAVMADLVRHEEGHSNGWPESHIGGHY